MGFRTGSYATVWQIDQQSDTLTKGRISISRKNKNTGEYETDFSGFVSFVGSGAARKAASLKERDRIKLGDVDVSSKYDKESGRTYTNFKVFSFDTDGGGSGSSNTQNHTVDDGEIDESDPRLPF